MSKGMTFYSPFGNYIAWVRPEGAKRHPVTGDVIEVIPAINAEFGQDMTEVEIIDPITGQRDTAIQGHGHFYNTIIAQEKNGWSDDEREMVERRLLTICQTIPEQCRLVDEMKNPKPWPTYDETPANKIPTLASSLGLLMESIAYEEQNKNRQTLLDNLKNMVIEPGEPEQEDTFAASV